MAFGDIIQTEQANAYPTTSVTVTISAAVAGNLLVCTHMTGAVNSIAPSGYAEAVVVSDGGPNNDQMAMYWKIAAGGETSVVPESNQSDEHIAIVIEIEGPWNPAPVDKTAINDSTVETSTSSGTTDTTSQADEVAVAGVSCRERTGTEDNFTAWSNSFVEAGDGESHAKAHGSATKLLTATGAIETTATHTSTNGASMGCIATFMKSAVAAAPIFQRRENTLLRM